MIMRNIFQGQIDKLIVLSSSKTGVAAIFVTIGTNPIFAATKFGVFFTFFSVMVIFLSNQQIMPFFGLQKGERMAKIFVKAMVNKPDPSLQTSIQLPPPPPDWV